MQCLTLLWTHVRQSPDPRYPEIDKAIIVCPSTLVRNWANEIKKWLGPNAINALICDNSYKTKDDLIRDIKMFANSRRPSIMFPVMIISYETLRIHSALFGNNLIGLMLCDEGHRLKNSANQTFQALSGLNVKMRVIMSGTPIQNDLNEYFSLLNFANPGLLGTPAEFRKNYEIPILKGRDSTCTDSERLLSQEKLSQLTALSNRFIIRRTNDLLTQYLPVKFDHVVFCQLSTLQREIYKLSLSSSQVKSLLSSNNEETTNKGSFMPLKAITSLKKLCNHPSNSISDF